MRPLDPADASRPAAEPTLFERWMGVTPEEWEALGSADEEAAEEQPRLF